ncbi:hypothetical protein I532_20481 [Brevibacillus borstelensis AK1]|uniref:Uncharacterized protein n=1 Tax=Brevibacillus borstelensis AK1 TaxID=1300222 RepID=M8DBJ7_9BACL|nr:hypothetical protein I532_20481 [Brevibacillus borstelensis AK1]KKX55954.1 hypothetical protein X546_09995 [Brevibacillus borstelensis cifa_chp40]
MDLQKGCAGGLTKRTGEGESPVTKLTKGILEQRFFRKEDDAFGVSSSRVEPREILSSLHCWATV